MRCERNGFFFLVMAGLLLLSQAGWAQPQGGRGTSPEAEAFKAAQQQKGLDFQERETQEGKDFLATLTGKKKGEKLQAITEFKTLQYQKNCEFREQMNKDRRAFVEQRMQANTRMPPAAKEKFLARIDAEFAEMKTFFAQKQQENLDFFEKMKNDPKMDGSALDKALQEFLQAQKASAQKFMQEKKSAR